MSRKGRKGRGGYIESRDDVLMFSRQFARKYGLKAERVEDLVDVVWQAVFTSASGQISIRKATSLALRFLGNVLDVI